MGFVNYKPLRNCGMEELAEHVRSANATGGIRFARALPGIEKQLARQKIYELFSTEVWPGRLLMLTMPGVGWEFERTLLDMRKPAYDAYIHENKGEDPSTFFIGVENDRPAFFASCTQMPGIATTARRKIKMIRKFPFAETGFQTSLASFFFASIEDYLQYQVDATEPYPVDAAWLDFTGQLTPRRMSLMAAFYERCVKSTMIVTVLNGRDHLRGHREGALARLLPGDVLHSFTYRDTAPMLQFAVRRTDGRILATRPRSEDLRHNNPVEQAFSNLKAAK